MPRFGEDVRNVTLIAGSAAIGLAATAALFFAGSRAAPRTVVRVAPLVEVRMDRMEPLVIEAPRLTTPGTERIWGRVETLQGRSAEGFIRWDRNEGSWADLMDALKESGSGEPTQTGVRFGHIDRIEATGDRSAWVRMRNGESFELFGSSTDLGDGMRGLTVESADGTRSEFRWADLAEVDFGEAPAGASSTEQRLHGRLTTRAGHEFVGYVAWDIDEIYASDVLDGEMDGRDVDVPFGAIASIERRGPDGARVTLRDGGELFLRGSDDVSRGNAGITVSDPALGQVKVDWMDVEAVEFFPPESAPRRSDFDGGARVTGTVIGSSGDSWTGAVTWDRDEAWGWEILNGHLDDAEFFVEFGQVTRIEKLERGSRLTLRDGRVFELVGSQDVDTGNRGIRVEADDGAHDVSWSDFREFRIDR